MSERAVVDTGPLVAIVRVREEAHGRCVAVLEGLHAPLLTCWPVLTEAAWLLRNEPGGMKALGGLVQSGAVKLSSWTIRPWPGSSRTWTATPRWGPNWPMPR